MVCRWENSGLDEVGVDASTGVVRIKVNSKYFRNTEVVIMDCSFYIINSFILFFYITLCLLILKLCWENNKYSTTGTLGIW